MVLGMLHEDGQTIVEVDPDRLERILNNLQANILKSHGRDETHHLFLRFTGAPVQVKEWIRKYAQNPNQVTSAAKQLEDAKKRRDSIERGDNPIYSAGLLGCFFLSAAGYRFLGFPTSQFEDSFRRGMKNREDYVVKLGVFLSSRIENKDPESGAWQEGYQAEIHAMLLLARSYDDPGSTLDETVAQIKNELAGIAEVVVEEHGIRKVNNKGKDLEHFDFKDGISNPLFFRKEIEERQRSRYDQATPLDLVLAKDPFAGDDQGYGSYLVFRKIKQGVGAFNTQVTELSEKVNVNQESPKQTRELTEAQIVGRFKDGTPVTDWGSPQDLDSATINDFNYATDDGSRCLVHAHIRKANPRNGTEQLRRIVRRGIPYGKEGEAEVGLLFMCYQSNIHNQFEFIQRVWLDTPNFPVEGAGVDPLAGQDNVEQQWLKEYNNPKMGTKAFNFGGHVTLQGGEYFFAPSLSFLKNLKEENMPERSVLVVATYNHEKYRQLIGKPSTKNPKNFALVSSGLQVPDRLDLLDEAQDIAIKLFGAVTTGRDIPPEEPLENLFTFLDAFEYFKVADNVISIQAAETEMVRDKLFANLRYGWVALVSEIKLDVLKEKIGWPDHPFCSVFDIQFIPLQGDFEKYDALKESEAWRQRGLDVYEHQTPASWSK